MLPPDPRDARIAQLEAEVATLRKELAELRAIVGGLLRDKAMLQDENEELRRRLGANSQNSSNPPSSDPPGTPRSPTRPSGRKPGGQPGHKGSRRELLPVEAVDHLRAVKPRRCSRCNHVLTGEDHQPLRHQVTELPAISPQVTEYQLHTLVCRDCGAATRAELPEGVSWSAFGPNVHALVALLAGKFRLSHRLVKSLLEDVFGVDAAVGSITAMERRVSAVLEVPALDPRGLVGVDHLRLLHRRQRLRTPPSWSCSGSTMGGTKPPRDACSAIDSSGSAAPTDTAATPGCR